MKNKVKRLLLGLGCTTAALGLAWSAASTSSAGEPPAANPAGRAVGREITPAELQELRDHPLTLQEMRDAKGRDFAPPRSARAEGGGLPDPGSVPGPEVHVPPSFPLGWEPPTRE